MRYSGRLWVFLILIVPAHFVIVTVVAIFVALKYPPDALMQLIVIVQFLIAISAAAASTFLESFVVPKDRQGARFGTATWLGNLFLVAFGIGLSAIALIFGLTTPTEAIILYTGWMIAGNLVLLRFLI